MHAFGLGLALLGVGGLVAAAPQSVPGLAGAQNAEEILNITGSAEETSTRFPNLKALPTWIVTKTITVITTSVVLPPALQNNIKYVAIPTPSIVQTPPTLTLPLNGGLSTTVQAQCTQTQVTQTSPSLTVKTSFICPYPTCLDCLQPPPYGCGGACWGAVPCSACSSSSCSKCTSSAKLPGGATGIVISSANSLSTVTLQNINSALATAFASLPASSTSFPSHLLSYISFISMPSLVIQPTTTTLAALAQRQVAQSTSSIDVSSSMPTSMETSTTSSTATATNPSITTGMTYISKLGVSVPLSELTRSFLVAVDGTFTTGINTAIDTREAVFVPEFGITMAIADMAQTVAVLSNDITLAPTPTSSTSASKSQSSSNAVVTSSSSSIQYTVFPILGLTVPVNVMTQIIQAWSSLPSLSVTPASHSYTTFTNLGLTVPVSQLTQLISAYSANAPLLTKTFTSTLTALSTLSIPAQLSTAFPPAPTAYTFSNGDLVATIPISDIPQMLTGLATVTAPGPVIMVSNLLSSTKSWPQSYTVISNLGLTIPIDVLTADINAWVFASTSRASMTLTPTPTPATVNVITGVTTSVLQGISTTTEEYTSTIVSSSIVLSTSTSVISSTSSFTSLLPKSTTIVINVAVTSVSSWTSSSAVTTSTTSAAPITTTSTTSKSKTDSKLAGNPQKPTTTSTALASTPTGVVQFTGAAMSRFKPTGLALCAAAVLAFFH